MEKKLKRVPKDPPRDRIGLREVFLNNSEKETILMNLSNVTGKVADITWRTQTKF